MSSPLFERLPMWTARHPDRTHPAAVSSAKVSACGSATVCLAADVLNGWTDERTNVQGSSSVRVDGCAFAQRAPPAEPEMPSRWPQLPRLLWSSLQLQ